jgi:CRISPR-associated endonuclease/helicase Cas3
MTLTGFTILCDWLGSDHTIFKPTPGTTLEDYLAVSAERATHAVDKAGFFQESISQAPTQFAQLFAGKIQPRPLQAAIDRIPSEVIRNPCLTVIEAPTGEGKTEAALALAHRIAREIGSDELYYALPTTATSNQMFGRLQKFLIENLGLSSQVKLVHGQAFLFEDDLQIRPLSNGAADGKPGAAEWFAPKKRSLLAPFGVGTIDQAELAALNVRHVPLRMIGLAGKVIIVDEVHAYDIYMTTIIERLLEWLAALGTSVILLSATLPKERRARLARAFSGVVSQGTGPDAYPSIWIVDTNGNTYASEPQAAQSNRKIFLYPNVLHYSDEEAQEKAEWLINSVADGGCVCWMTNTVKRAQQMFDALDRLAPDDFERTLIHAQFPLETRQILEQEITKKYGPDTSCRPAIGVVIGTQVLEQSLDLDFDLLVSDIAPMDLLLQRAGRLHRHKHPRPVSNSLPRFWLNSETGSSGLSISVDQYVYSEYILRLTWDQLKDRQEINLPDDYRALIESVYGGAMAESDELLTAAWKKLQREESQATAAAQLALLPAPQAEDSFSGPAAHLEFIESDNQSSWIVARTRLGEESLTIIPIERDGNSIGVVLDGSILTIPLEGALSRENQLKLLRRSIRVSNRRLVEILKNQEQENLPLEISGAPLLKDVYWLWLSEGRAIFRDHTGIIKVEIDSRLGLVIQTEKGA